MRTIVVGDVHGCLDELQDLLKEVSFNEGKDKLIQVGDFMDRGPDPLGCLRFLRKTADVVLLGNHEDKHIRWRREVQKAKDTGKKNPMRPMHGDRLAQNAEITDDELEWLKSLPMLHTLPNKFVVVHAGLEPAFPANRQGRAVMRVRYVDDLGEMRGTSAKDFGQPPGTVLWNKAWKGPESVIYGHIHTFKDPVVDKFKSKGSNGACYGIDTGCVFGGYLTAAVLTNGQAVEFAQVKARAKYCDPPGPKKNVETDDRAEGGGEG